LSITSQLQRFLADRNYVKVELMIPSSSVRGPSRMYCD